MSLKVWLPLNGNTENKGCSSFVFTNSASSAITVSSAGKIGSCYNFNSSASNNGIYTQDNGFMSDYINNKSWSLCAWIKTTSTDTCIMSLSYGLRLFAGSSPIISLYNSSRTVNCSSSIGTTDGNWHHIAATYDVTTGAIKFYVDGNNTGNATYTSGYTYASSWNNGIFIGRDPNNSTVNDHYLYKGYMNDVRIYTHCLSAAEVHEISQGLVLHYKLNEPNPNMLLMTPKSYTPTTYCGYQLSLNENLIADQTYTLQLWDVTVEHSAKTATQMNLCVYWGGGSIQLKNFNGTSNFKTLRDHYAYSPYLVATFTVTSSQASGSGATNAWFNIYNSVGWVSGTVNMHIGTWKLEKGNIATSWTPNITTIIEDSSGYNHHGEVISTLSLENDTPRYTGSIHISATNQKIKISNFPTTGFGNSYSFAWWAKISSNGPMHWGFADGIRVNGLYNGNLWNTGDSANNPLYNPGTTTQVTVPSVNTWHHWVMTGNGTKCYVYQDGVLWGEAKTYKSISGSTIYINGWDSGTSYCSSNYSISDFRIYCTALSADDVLTLYHTSARVDNKQNLHAFELIENSAQKITKQGQIKCQELDEISNTKFYKTGIVETNQIIEF